MLIEPNCSIRECKHYTGIAKIDGTGLTEVNICVAFPKGIPFEIAYGEHDHTTPYKGDNGIRFEPMK
jgi:hypothetical protein